uniref:Uncharacterized protein n=1 Tax=Scytodes thoracica TaxID=1112478 RepID=A0A0A0V701_SCYTH|nr:hypothetical protein [Scytodes thoracica]
MQELFDMIVAEPQAMQKQMCTHGTDERAQYLKNAPCFQKVLSNDNLKPHIDDFMAALEKATEVKFDQRIPAVCCGFQRFFTSMINLVEEDCGTKVLDEGSLMLGLSVTSISDMFCKGYQKGSPKCEGILPPSGSPYKGVESDNQLIRFVASAMANFAK